MRWFPRWLMGGLVGGLMERRNQLFATAGIVSRISHVGRVPFVGSDPICHAFRRRGDSVVTRLCRNRDSAAGSRCLEGRYARFGLGS